MANIANWKDPPTYDRKTTGKPLENDGLIRFCGIYPLVNVYITMERSTILLTGKLTKILLSFSMGILT